jgi:hypothetical protein
MCKFPPPDKDTTEASATQDGGGSTSTSITRKQRISISMDPRAMKMKKTAS